MKKELLIDEKKISKKEEKDVRNFYSEENEKHMKDNLLYRMIMLFD